jgi:hypothetical protein
MELSESIYMNKVEQYQRQWALETPPKKKAPSLCIQTEVAII